MTDHGSGFGRKAGWNIRAIAYGLLAQVEIKGE
jgi:hypothetical protein